MLKKENQHKLIERILMLKRQKESTFREEESQHFNGWFERGIENVERMEKWGDKRDVNFLSYFLV